jgi:hypothetical protein
MGCIDPEVMKQEEMFVQLLTEVTKFTRNGNMLTLIDDEGTAKARLVELDSLLIRTSQAYPEAGPPETARVNRTICDPCHLGARMSSLHHLAESPRERSMNAV